MPNSSETLIFFLVLPVAALTTFLTADAIVVSCGVAKLPKL